MTGEEIKKSSLKKFTITSSSSSSTNLISESTSESTSKSTSELNSNILWGSKLEYIFKEIKIILSKNTDNKILIFSQWDKMLDIISNMLKYYYINFTNCKGNVYQINKAIREFKTNPTCSILLLSAETSNSGINLPEVSHIILIDTVSHIHSNVIEKQAIGRAVRIGQTKNVEVNRLIINDSIEFDYYLKSIINLNS
jgi:SNF2 family DNA or RNA helicase